LAKQPRGFMQACRKDTIKTAYRRSRKVEVGFSGANTMANGKRNSVLRQLRRVALLRGGPGLTDGELLERYLASRDEAAFESLLQRHGPMVLGVCRRVLRNEADAHDAFQATFLVFVRKAPSIGQRQLVANWLYGVAHKTALKARAL